MTLSLASAVVFYSPLNFRLTIFLFVLCLVALTQLSLFLFLRPHAALILNYVEEFNFGLEKEWERWKQEAKEKDSGQACLDLQKLYLYARYLFSIYFTVKIDGVSYVSVFFWCIKKRPQDKRKELIFLIIFLGGIFYNLGSSFLRIFCSLAE